MCFGFSKNMFSISYLNLKFSIRINLNLNLVMKKVFVLLLICFGLNQVQAYQFAIADEETLVKLMDGLSQAMVKNDTAWLEANLTDDCTLNDPSGQLLTKANIIQAFSASGVYTLESMKATEMKFTIENADASGSGNIELDGTMATPDLVDISGTYGIKTGFTKTDSGWKISSIAVSQ